MTPRILILSASVGAGHVRAAEAVELALRQLEPRAHVKNVDVLKLTNYVFRRVYGQGYFDLANNLPHVLGHLYDMLDREPTGRQISDRLRRMAQRMQLRRLIRLLVGQPWDVVINTHFLPAEVIAALKRKGKFASPQIVTVTDFETHRLWVNEPCEHYFTATDEAAMNLHSWGVPETATTVAGIPIHPAFGEPKSRAVCLARHGLRGDRPIVLQLAGGFGVGPIEKLYQAILAAEEPLELIVVTGRNAAIKAKLEQIERPERHAVHLLGFTTDMDELMAVADVVVSKPGGLTTSEALARGAAMAIVSPIPGQEDRNSDFLLENGAAIKANNFSTLPHKLTALLRDSRRLQLMKVNARRLGRPDAALAVARRALDLATWRPNIAAPASRFARFKGWWTEKDRVTRSFDGVN